MRSELQGGSYLTHQPVDPENPVILSILNWKGAVGEQVKIRRDLLTGGWATAAAGYDALLHVCLEDAEGLFVSLDRHVERLQHALGCEVIDDDPLLHVDRFGRDAEWLRVEAEVED